MSYCLFHALTCLCTAVSCLWQLYTRLFCVSIRPNEQKCCPAVQLVSKAFPGPDKISEPVQIVFGHADKEAIQD